MPRKTGSRALAEKIRAGALRALAHMSAKGITIEDIWEEMFTQDPFKAMQAVAQFLPKEMLLEIDDARPWILAHQPQTQDEWLQAQRVIEHEPAESVKIQ